VALSNVTTNYFTFFQFRFFVNGNINQSLLSDNPFINPNGDTTPPTPDTITGFSIIASLIGRIGSVSKIFPVLALLRDAGLILLLMIL
jgi:hypothetical protein